MMPPMPPAAKPDNSMVPCPHCGKAVSLQQAAAGPVAKAPMVKKAGPPMVAKKPTPKKNAANAPMDELKEVIKAQDKANG